MVLMGTYARAILEKKFYCFVGYRRLLPEELVGTKADLQRVKI